MEKTHFFWKFCYRHGKIYFRIRNQQSNRVFKEEMEFEYVRCAEVKYNYAATISSLKEDLA